MEIDIWATNFPSNDFLWAYLNYWLEGDPDPSGEDNEGGLENETSNLAHRAMCQFSADHECSWYNQEMLSFGFADSSQSFADLLKENDVPDIVANEAAKVMGSKVDPENKINSFIALWVEHYDEPRSIQRPQYEIYYIGRFLFTK